MENAWEWGVVLILKLALMSLRFPAEGFFFFNGNPKALFFRVPNTYLEYSFFAFLDFSACNKINKLHILGRESEFNSPSRHQPNWSLE